jgi:ParB/RepB/Spo0J family partition protein
MAEDTKLEQKTEETSTPAATEQPKKEEPKSKKSKEKDKTPKAKKEKKEDYKSTPINSENDKLKIVLIDQVEPDPKQPRRDVEGNKAISDLAESLRQHGMMNPIHVRDMGNDKYQIINGERRYWAAKKAELKNIPVIIREIAEGAELALKQLVDNLQREDLHPLDEAAGYARLMDEFKLKQKDVVKQVGRSKQVISETIRIHKKLSDAVKEKVRRAGLNIPKRTLVKISRKGKDMQLPLLEKYLSQNKETIPGYDRKNYFGWAYMDSTSRVSLFTNTAYPAQKEMVEILKRALKDLQAQPVVYHDHRRFVKSQFLLLREGLYVVSESQAFKFLVGDKNSLDVQWTLIHTAKANKGRWYIFQSESDYNKWNGKKN